MIQVPAVPRVTFVSLALALAMAAISLLVAPHASAAAATFDHFTTGYELIGEHRSAPCAACHVGGIFKGTPTDCSACHVPGSRIGATAKPTTHIISTNDCSQCHTPFAWKPVANFNHLNVVGTCSSCHNSVQSIGKPRNHIPTTAECSTCHLTMRPWSAANFAHTGITGNCVSCHDNVHAPGKPATHLPTAASCESCHSPSNFTTFAGTQMNHAGIVNNCQACHETGMSWYGLTMVDRPTPAQDSLHPLATAPNGADCSVCHTGFAVGDFALNSKPKNHIPTAPNAPCGSCHTLSNFAAMPTLANIHLYAPSTTTNCSQCHGAAAASFAIPAAGFSIVGLPAAHIPTTASCESCHVGAGSSVAATPVPNGAKFTNSAMSHAGITTGCVTCHGPTITGASFTGITQIVAMPATSPVGATSHVPSGTTCESCHLGSTPAAFVPANATVTAPGTKFATPVPTTVQIHTGITSGCTSCHETNDVWMGMASYPLAPPTLSGNSATQYLGFNTRPAKTASSPFTIADAAHPVSGDCAQCHTGTAFFSGNIKPANHIPTAPTAQCTDCHKGADFSVLPALADIHAFAPSTTTNCTQCHGAAAASFAIPAAAFSIVGLPTGHVPTTTSCEACHVGAGSSVVTTPVPNGAKFTNSAMGHSGITTGCATCHGPTITGASFLGITKIVVMPPTSPVGAASHVPSSTTCESCHLGSTPAALVPANATLTAPGTKFAAPVPTTAQIHAGITTGCASCHENGDLWMGMNSYPISPTALTGNSNTQYLGFNTRPATTAGAFAIADPAHPATGDCAACHSSTTYFDGNLKPANHIPTLATATCANCHTTSNFATIPTLANIHLYAPSTTTNCSQCHGAAAASFAIPAAGFSIVGLPAAHIPTTAACESCHVGAGSSIAATPVPNGAKFTNSAISHAGITTGCATCHGPTITGATFTGITKIIVMPATSPAGATSHVPSSTTCESCHLGSTPAALVPGNATLTAPGTKFAAPVPTTAQIHAGITTGCASCHESAYLWMGMSNYPISPTSLSANSSTQYLGFNTRPGATGGTFQIADAAHPATGDCSACHGNTTYFEGNLKPANHIPTLATATCANCHTTSNFATIPTLANIHLYAPSTTSNCTQCHGAAAGSFAIPAAGFSIVGLPAAHIPTTASCESCHVGAGSSIAATPVPNGAKFTNSAMSHSGITTGCASCHGPTITGASFTGITKIIVMPPTSPVGASSHVPSGTTCESCHLGSTPGAFVPANATLSAPGTKFATPVPTTAQIHTGISSGCQSCHESTDVWMGMANYPISPKTLSGNTGTQYTGFNTRPTAAASTYSVADAAHPATGDCVTCHGAGFTYFSGQAEPSNHIPTLTQACATCHTTAGNFAVYTANLTTLHSVVATTCSTCHADGKGPFAGVAGFTIVQMSTRGVHIPITKAGVAVECSGCHKTVTAFSGTVMSHAAIGDAGTSAAGNACDACHEYGMRSKWFGLSTWQRDSANHYYCAPGGTTICPNGGADCTTGCHQHSVSSQYAAAPKPTVKKQLTSSVAAALAAPNGRFDHTSITAACSSCHNGVAAVGKPAAHPQSGGNCDRCHTTSAWLPAAFDHASVLAGTCATCHTAPAAALGAASAATVKAMSPVVRHTAVMSACDSCHYTLGWTPTKAAKTRTPAQQPATPTRPPVLTRPTTSPRSGTAPPVRQTDPPAPLS